MRAQSPFIDVEALSDEDDDIPLAATDFPDAGAARGEPVKSDFKEEVEVRGPISSHLPNSA